MKLSKRFYQFVIIFTIFIGVAVIAGGIYGYLKYKSINEPNIFTKDGSDYMYLYVPGGASVEMVLERINEKANVKDFESLKWLAGFKKMNKVYPGKYKITNGMCNNMFLNKIRIGDQVPIKFTLNFFRFKEEIIQKAAETIEADLGDMSLLINDTAFLNKKGFNSNTVIAMFIPNTYEFKWNTDAQGFLDRMYTEYRKFWNEERMEKAKALGMTPVEVITLASIVDRESKMDDEKPRIAGVYINRLKKDMALQADPTVVYSVGNFKMRRVLKRHIENDSPYNTYKNRGLPPGPICTPSIASIDAVLNYEQHNYIYFCASETFNGYHNFASTLKQHNLNASKFQSALNKKKIYK